MEIKRDDVREISRLILRKITEDNMDTVMVPYRDKLENNNIHFLSGTEDNTTFYAAIPDAHDYEAVGARDLYELLVSIDQGRTPPRFVVEREFYFPDLIDLTSMLQDKALKNAIQIAVSHMAPFGSDSVGSIEAVGRERLVEQIKYNLEKLCKDQFGASVATGLWKQFGEFLHTTPPDLAVSRRDRWFDDSAFRPLSGKAPKLDHETIARYMSTGWGNKWDTRDKMVLLGSALDLNSLPSLNTGDTVLVEHQKHGRSDRPDILDISWHIREGAIEECGIVLRKYIDVPGGIIAGVNVTALEDNFRAADWRSKYFNMGDNKPFFSDVFDPSRRDVVSAADGLRRLFEGDAEGVRVAEMLYLKYLAYSPNSVLLENGLPLKSAYERRIVFSPDFQVKLNIAGAYNLLDGRQILARNGPATLGGGTWYAVAPGIHSVDGTVRLMAVASEEDLNVSQDYSLMSGRKLSAEDRMRIEGGGKALLPIEIEDVVAERIIYADAFKRKLIIDKEESEFYHLYRVSDRELYKPRFDSLRGRLADLVHDAKKRGIGDKNLETIQEEVIVRRKSFEIFEEREFGNAMAIFKFNIRDHNNPSFGIASVDAAAYQMSGIKGKTINGVDIEKLDKAMSEVNWSNDYWSEAAMKFHASMPGGDKDGFLSSAEVLEKMVALAEGPDPRGKDVSADLTFRYLKNTPNEARDLTANMERRMIAARFTGPLPFNMNAMFNLMSGRSVLSPKLDQGMPSGNWYRLTHPESKSIEAKKLEIASEEFLVFPLLTTIPLMNIGSFGELSNIAASLEQGNVERVGFAGRPAPFDIFIFADPAADTIKVDLFQTAIHAGFGDVGEKLTKKTVSITEFIAAAAKSVDISEAFRNFRLVERAKRRSSGGDPGDGDSGNRRGRKR